MPSFRLAVSPVFTNLLYETRRKTIMGQASCRVPDALDSTLQAAADEMGVFRSDVIQRALIYYIQVNPHELDAFSRGVTGRRSSQVYDPTSDV